MAWTEADLKIFAAGLAIGGEWNGRMPGGSMFDTPIMRKAVMSDIYATDISTSIMKDTIMGNIFMEDLIVPITKEVIVSGITEE